MDSNFDWINEYNLKNNNEYINYIKIGQYLAVFKPNHHKANKEGYVYIHQLQAEKKLGRQLNNEEVVHHIDENKFNNDIDNLMVFKSKSDHTAFHNGIKIRLENDVWVADIKTIKINGKSGKYELCPVCKTNYMSCGARMCINCTKENSKNKLNNKIERSELKKLIRNTSFVSISKMFGITDNAVRRWCDSYGLPRKVSIIKNISDEEWESI